MTTITVGLVTYNVRTKCPHCTSFIYLGEYPYNDPETNYSIKEELEEALFADGSSKSTWQNTELKVKCDHCRKHFTVGPLKLMKDRQ